MIGPGSVLDGRYELLELLGEGGMGQVFKARHNRLGKIFAVKSLRHLSPDPVEQAKFLEAFETEARTLAELDHPALAKVSDFFESESIHFLVMEFIDGKTLSRVVELAPRNLSQRRVVQWANELCEVLHYLHSQQRPVIVRDLKPENILIDGKRRLRLIDFGISKRLQPGEGTRDIVKGMGTAEYAPLEQYGSSTTDQRSDIYAFGATLYFLLTEIAPPPAWKRASEGVEPTPPSAVNPTVSPELDQLVLKMMALKKEHRPQSIAEVRSELARIPGKAKTGSTSHSVPRAPRVTPRPSPPKVTPKAEPNLQWAKAPGPPSYDSHDSVADRKVKTPGAPTYKPPLDHTGPQVTPPSGPIYESPSTGGAQRYSIPGSSIEKARTVIRPALNPSGRIPQVEVKSCRSLRRYATVPQSVRFCPGRPLAAVAGRYLQLWSMDTEQVTGKLWSGEQQITSLEFSADGRFLASAETEGEIRVYDVGEQKKTAQLGRRSWGLFPDRVRDVCFLFGQHKVAVASDTSNIRIFSALNGEVIELIEWHQTGLFSKLSRKTVSLSSSRDGLLATGGADGSITIYDTGRFEKKEHKTFSMGEVQSLEFSPDGQFLAACGSRGKLFLLKPEGLEVVHELKHPASPLAVAFSHDLRLIASGSSDCQIRLFHFTSGKELLKLSHHTGAVLDLDFSDSRRSLVSVGNDRRLYLTDLSW